MIFFFKEVLLLNAIELIKNLTSCGSKNTDIKLTVTPINVINQLLISQQFIILGTY